MSSNSLPQGNWRLDPFARVVRFVPAPPKTPRTPKPCGTPAAYNRHHAHNETPCDPCREAAAAYRSNLRRHRKAA